MRAPVGPQPTSTMSLTSGIPRSTDAHPPDAQDALEFFLFSPTLFQRPPGPPAQILPALSDRT